MSVNKYDIECVHSCMVVLRILTILQLAFFAKAPLPRRLLLHFILLWEIEKKNLFFDT